MRLLLATLLTSTLLATCAHAAPGTNTTSLTLAWLDPNPVPALPQYFPKTNDCYLIVATNIVGAPISTWPVVKVVTNWSGNFSTNSSGLWITNSVNVVPDSWFFSVIISNFWGNVAVPSNVEQTGQPPAFSAANLNATR